MQSTVTNQSKPADNTLVNAPTPEELSPAARTGKAAPFAVVGRTERDDGPVLMHQVFVNVQAGKSAKSGTDCLPLHEIPLARAKQMHMGGGRVVILPGWVPLTPQAKGLTKAGLIKELERLRGKQQISGGPFEDGKYIVPRGDQMINLFPNIYGGEHGSKLTFFDRIEAFYRGFMELEERSRQDATMVTVDQIEGLIAKVCPSQAEDELDNLPSILRAKDEMAITAATSPNDAHKALIGDHRLSEWLTLHHQLRPEDAHGAAILYASVRDGMPDDKRSTDAAFKKADWSIVPAVAAATDKKVKEKRTARFIDLLLKWDKMPKMA